MFGLGTVLCHALCGTLCSPMEMDARQVFVPYRWGFQGPVLFVFFILGCPNQRPLGPFGVQVCSGFWVKLVKFAKGQAPYLVKCLVKFAKGQAFVSGPLEQLRIGPNKCRFPLGCQAGPKTKKGPTDQLVWQGQFPRAAPRRATRGPCWGQAVPHEACSLCLNAT